MTAGAEPGQPPAGRHRARRWRAWAQAAWGKVGRRGLFLLFLAFLDFTFGYSLFRAETAHPRLVVYDLLLTTSEWAVIWFAGGVVCLTGVAASKDRWAFAWNAGLFTAWAIINGYVWIGQHLRDGWVAVTIWLAFAAVILLISSWPEAPPRQAAHE